MSDSHQAASSLGHIKGELRHYGEILRIKGAKGDQPADQAAQVITEMEAELGPLGAFDLLCTIITRADLIAEEWQKLGAAPDN